MNGLENKYIIKNNKRLRYGYTTGSCAAGAASGAVRMLLSGRELSEERFPLRRVSPLRWLFTILLEEIIMFPVLSGKMREMIRTRLTESWCM